MVSQTFGFALRERIQKMEKIEEFSIDRGLAIKLFFFTKQPDVFWSTTLFKPISVCF